eukprot:3427021-Pyramimonas_sp.AAC.1
MLRSSKHSERSQRDLEALLEEQKHLVHWGPVGSAECWDPKRAQERGAGGRSALAACLLGRCSL